MSKLKVLISGAGLGGLCLAQSLKRQGITVEVFERDKSPWDRPQGYRLHIDSDGVNALKDSLPSNLFQLFDATSMKAQPFTTIIGKDLKVLKRISSDEHGDTHQPAAKGLPTHVNVNRATLRQILLTSLDENIQFGKKLTHYESNESGVTIFFEDGTSAKGDILVGADGIKSTVRSQRLPHAATQDTGVRAIYGRVPMIQALKYMTNQAREDVFTVAVDCNKVFLGLGPVLFPNRPELAAAELVPGAEIRPQADYVVCIIGGRTEFFGISDSDLRQLKSPDLQKLASKMIEGWPEPAKAIPANADPDSFFSVEMFTSIPCEMPKHSSVTLLGDAIHAMTPTLGRGANIAMRDAAHLGGFLSEVIKGHLTIAQALSLYEDQMTAYGFDVVRESAAMGERLMGQKPLPDKTQVRSVIKGNN